MPDPDVFVITGASSGIGAATARRAAEPATASCSPAWKDRLDALVEELGGAERALAVETDVTIWEDNEALIGAVTDAFGSVDVVFANAGFGASRGWLEETPDHWRDMVLTNVLGAAYTVRAAIPALKASRGHVLLTGSVAGRRVLPGSLYSSTKWAVTAMAEAVRADLNGTGIRTTLISPGGVQTPFFDTPAEGRLEPDDVGAPCSTPSRSPRTSTSTRCSSVRPRRSSERFAMRLGLLVVIFQCLTNRALAWRVTGTSPRTYARRRSHSRSRMVSPSLNSAGA